MDKIIDFLLVFFNLFVEMSFYMLIGLLFVGLLHIYFTKDFVKKFIGRDSIWSIIKASILGVPLPLCSCGVVPSAVYFAKNGASPGAVVSFLSSTPQTGVDSIIATYGMLGPVFAIFRPFAALFIGIINGIVVKFTTKNNFDFSLSSAEENDSNIKGFTSKVKKMYNYAFIEFFDDISAQFVVGLLIAALITFFVPDSFFNNSSFSSGIIGMLIMIAVGVPMYICATASIPIAVSLLIKGFSPGVAFVFLAVGPATNAATFAILIKALGKKTAFIYLSSLIIMSIVFGYLLDLIFNTFGFDYTAFISEQHCNTDASSFSIWYYLAAGIFGLLLISSLYRKYLRKYFVKINKRDDMLVLQVSGMNCNHCVNNVKNAINSIDGAVCNEVNLSTETAVIEGEFDKEALKNKIEQAGYKVSEK